MFIAYPVFIKLTDTLSDMANINVPWEVQGIITPEESVSKMIHVIQTKGIQHSGTFWTWENTPYVW